MDSLVGCGHLGSSEFILCEKELNIGEEKKQNPKGTTVVGARKVTQQAENLQAAVLSDGEQPMVR